MCSNKGRMEDAFPTIRELHEWSDVATGYSAIKDFALRGMMTGDLSLAKLATMLSVWQVFLGDNDNHDGL